MAQMIKILPEVLCNQIAAGEVVERPSSVVKELLENSLDAGATDICIEIEKGGKKLIRISDDGCGMNRDDAFLCLERHATSKITTEADLFSLNTLGFRGEALPSIASVSRFLLRTRNEASEEGWEIYAEGGTIKRADAAGCPCGTTIEIRDLFFNTPARKKFLRKDETELGHIGDVVTKMALANPAVKFRLLHNGRSLIEVYRQSRLEERLSSLLGRPVLKDLLPLESDGGGDLALHGFISQPSVHRSTTGSIYTFINGRYIRDRVVQHALMDGYRNLLVKGRYPIVVLFLSIDPALVDVNVHPTKHEVRFRDQRLVHDFITSSIREVLRPSSWLGEGGEPHTAPPVAPVEPPQSRPLEQVSAPFAKPGAGDAGSASYPERIQDAMQGYAGRSFAAAVEASGQGTRYDAPSAATQAIEEGPAGFFSSLHVIGQYRQSYILCQDGDDLVLIDQHAAHERIGFERLRSQFQRGQIETQALLFPAVLELDFNEAAVLEEHLDDLRRLGFDIEPFGGKSFALKAIPQLLGDSQAERLVCDVAGELATIGKSALAEEALDDVLILMACHNVVRANQGLGHLEMKGLLKELDQVDFSAHCPHGRPVMIRHSLGEIEKMFKRA